MRKKYVYRNVNERTVNISGYQFEKGQELESDILINGFNEAVSNGFLSLTERELHEAEPNATPAPQTGDTGDTGDTGNTGKVKVIFHMGLDAEGKEVLKEVELDPNTSVEFPSVDLGENETFEGWFKDANFVKPVNLDKAKSPKKGEFHFYGKYQIIKKEDTPPVNPNSNSEDRQVTLPPLPPPDNKESSPASPGNE